MRFCHYLKNKFYCTGDIIADRFEADAAQWRFNEITGKPIWDADSSICWACINIDTFGS